MKIRKFIYLGVVVSLLVSCGVPRDIVYIKDAPRGVETEIKNNYTQKIQIDDLLGIYVSTTQFGIDVSMFNKSGRVSYNDGNLSSQGYLVDQNGEIVFPYIGRLKVVGFTREMLRDTLETLLAKGGYLIEPVVAVNLLNFRFYTLGATGKMIVNNTANNMMKGERLTILQAIAMCGDLNIDGMRKNVTIIREQDGKRKIGTIDLTSKDLFDSPYYYVAQNDIIYVEPNDKAKRQANTDLTPLSVVSTVLGFATTILTLVYVILK